MATDEVTKRHRKHKTEDAVDLKEKKAKKEKKEKDRKREEKKKDEKDEKRRKKEGKEKKKRRQNRKCLMKNIPLRSLRQFLPQGIVAWYVCLTNDSLRVRLGPSWKKTTSQLRWLKSQMKSHLGLCCRLMN